MSEHTASLVLSNFIDGDFVPCNNYINSLNPATGKVWAKVPRSGADEVELAVKSAKKAYKKWSTTPVQERSRYLQKIADILESRLDEYAMLESCDQGKPVTLARVVDIPRAIYNFRVFASSALHQLNISSQMQSAGAVFYTTRSPIGVAGLISPWNLPLYLLTFKIAPAIVAGNTVVAKPSEMTSVTAWKLCSIFNEAGLPPGVVNIVFGLGSEAGNAIVSHPDIPLVSFTGGTETAKKIRMSAAPFCKRMSLELGGKNAAVIFGDADLEACIPTLLKSCFTNQGELCLCTSRVFVQKDIFDIFMAKFIPAVKEFRIGDPLDSATKVGALISKEHLEKVRGYVRIASEEGGSVHCGYTVDPETTPDHLPDGYFMSPTVITGLSDDSRCMQEEIFGPVACVTPFSNEDEVISRANDVQYGLCASVWTRDSGTLHRVSHALEVGTVWANCWLVRDLNMPFGGAKNSGIGRESTNDSFEFYTEVKTICIKI